MIHASATRNTVLAVGLARAGVGTAVILMLLATFAGRVAVGDSNPFDFFGYFTNLSSLLTSGVLITTGTLMMSGRPVPAWLTVARGVATACLLIVAVVYNGLVPGTASAPPWVSAVLHIFLPLIVAIDWLSVGDRGRLPWRQLWVVLPYPVVWVTVVLIRGATDGWVPYGFLLPERGIPSLIAHVMGLFVALVAAGAIVWAATRSPGIVLRRGGDGVEPAAGARKAERIPVIDQAHQVDRGRGRCGRRSWRMFR
ncbi:hypothetical protein GCM10011490_20980 [Pseudoclavibacter endophyticus]|uniref:Pr6Pr family membrane protein n=1 Tax=Pseudoclavibacter endophyticus TaxID=1778590 RepID=UPI0019BC1854|nr:Pr6Pr family membrane protein [Pseudoclavibacter endophyticus]GGA70148.1 hypothetical protein GCM10011490_20980 [Pseudoclavibacter endophyticus]